MKLFLKKLRLKLLRKRHLFYNYDKKAKRLTTGERR